MERTPTAPKEVPITPQAAVRRARALLGLSQQKLGAALGLRAVSVSRWETGRVAVPRDQRAALVKLVARRDRDAAAELAAALGLPQHVRAEAVGRRDPTARRAELDGVILRTAEALDVVPSLARRTAVELVTRLARIDMSPAEAATLLQGGALPTG